MNYTMSAFDNECMLPMTTFDLWTNLFLFALTCEVATTDCPMKPT